MGCFFEKHWHKSIWWILRCHRKPSYSFCFKTFSGEYIITWGCLSRCELIKQEFGKFSNIFLKGQNWRGVLKLVSLLKDCVAAVREGNGEVHFYTMQRFFFCFLYIWQHKLPQICILVSWKNEEAPRRVPSNIQPFSRRKMFSENERWIFRDQRSIWCYERRDTLEFSLFKGGNIAKHSKYELLNPLKKLLDTSVTGLAVALDFMSVTHKTGFGKHPKIKDSLKRVSNYILAKSKTKRIEIVHHSYLEQRITKNAKCNWGAHPNNEINLDSPVPSEIKKFWTSSINKETQTIVAIFFITEANQARKFIVLSGYVTDNDGSFDRLEMINDEVNQKADLNCIEEETDPRLILYFADAKAEGFKNFLVLSNDSDIVTYLSAYFDQFETKNVKKIWVNNGLKERQRHVTIHR